MIIALSLLSLALTSNNEKLSAWRSVVTVRVLSNINQCWWWRNRRWNILKHPNKREKIYYKGIQTGEERNPLLACAKRCAMCCLSRTLDSFAYRLIFSTPSLFNIKILVKNDAQLAAALAQVIGASLVIYAIAQGRAAFVIPMMAVNVSSGVVGSSLFVWTTALNVEEIGNGRDKSKIAQGNKKKTKTRISNCWGEEIFTLC